MAQPFCFVILSLIKPKKKKKKSFSSKKKKKMKENRLTDQANLIGLGTWKIEKNIIGDLIKGFFFCANKELFVNQYFNHFHSQMQ